MQPRVYEVEALTRRIRLLVAHQLPQEEQNALLHLFAAKTDLVKYGREHYRVRSSETSSLLLQLFERYETEGAEMPDLLEEFTRQTIDQLLRTLPVQKRLEGISEEKRLEGVGAEKRLKGLTLEQICEALAALPPEIRASLQQPPKSNGSSADPS